MKIILELDEDQTWALVFALNLAWAAAMHDQKYDEAQKLIDLQRLINEQQRAHYERRLAVPVATMIMR